MPNKKLPPKPKNILAIDIGTRCGWAHWNGTLLNFGTFNLKPDRHEDAGMRWIHFRTYLEEFKGLDLVVYEAVSHHKGTQAAHVYGGLVAILQAWCEDNGYHFTSVPVGTLKKHATGKGNASKEMMVMSANKAFGINHIKGGLRRPLSVGNDHDIADALWILDWARKEYS